VRGDVVQRTDNHGNVLHNYRFDAFGNQLNQDSINTNPFRFAGEYYDWETGFIYLRARFYNPVTGRFLSEDPHWNIDNMIFGDGGGDRPYIWAIMQSGNLFVYGVNNPVMWVDPSGKFITGAAAGGALLALANAMLSRFSPPPVQSAPRTAPPPASTIRPPAAPPTQQVAQQTANRTSTVTQPASQQVANRTTQSTQQTQQVANRTAQATQQATNRPSAQPPQESIRRFSAPAQHTTFETTRITEVQFSNRTITQNNNLFNPNFVDTRGRTNVQRMQNGLAPIGHDGRSVNIHHINQTNNSPLMEISATSHRQAGLHQNTGQLPSQINRQEFNIWRS